MTDTKEIGKRRELIEDRDGKRNIEGNGNRDERTEAVTDTNKIYKRRENNRGERWKDKY